MPTSRFQPSFGAGVLAPGLYARIDTAKYDVGLKVGYNVFVHVHGGVSNRAGTEFVAEVMDSTKSHRLVPFTRSETENYVLVFGDLEMRIIDNGAWLDDGGAPYEIASPYSEAQAHEMDYAQSVDVLYLAQKDVTLQKLSRTAVTSYSFSNWSLNPTFSAPTIVSVVASSSSGTGVYRYRASIVRDGVESFGSSIEAVVSADLNENQNKITITVTGGQAGDEYNIYKERGGIYGFIGFIEHTTGTIAFEDQNISADLTKTLVETVSPIGSANDRPSVVTIFQQRLIAANTLNEPETVFASRIGDFENFTGSRILRADDSFSKGMSAGGLARVKALLPLGELLIFTSSGEFSLSGPDGALVATNPIEKPFGYSGSRDVKPLVVEDTALFADRTGRQIRDLRYAFEQDGYAGNDLTVFVPHYFRTSRIAGWAFAKNPYSIIWAYLEDGTLLSLTYKREHQVWAWCDHDLSGGKVEQIAVIPEGDFDAVYMVVRRTIGGATKRYIERMDNRQFINVEDAFFVDCGVKYDGSATSIISGLDHLEGETVVALADGDVVENLTVSSGSVTLPKAASKVAVGLPYYAEIENLPPAVDLPGSGSSRGRPIKINKMDIQVERTRGIKAGHKRDKLNEFIQTKQDLSLPIPMETGIFPISFFPNFNKDGTAIIRQDYPLPMTILGISPHLTIGRTDD